MEIRPIVGVRNQEYEFIVNPIVDIGFGKFGEQHFAPAARFARKFGEDLFAGFEYYSDLGQIGRFDKFADQQHTLFAVTDFKAGIFDVNFGVGYGLTPASDRWVVNHHRLRLSRAGSQNERDFLQRSRQPDGAWLAADFPTLIGRSWDRCLPDCITEPPRKRSIGSSWRCC